MCLVLLLLNKEKCTDVDDEVMVQVDVKGTEMRKIEQNTACVLVGLITIF